MQKNQETGTGTAEEGDGVGDKGSPDTQCLMYIDSWRLKLTHLGLFFRAGEVSGLLEYQLLL
jgi:hypothetical protein